MGGGGSHAAPRLAYLWDQKDRCAQRTGGQNPLVNKKSLFLH